MNIVEPIKELANENKITIAELERKLGFAASSIRKWNESIPSIEKVTMVANFFNVSLDYLIGNSPLKSNRAGLSEKPLRVAGHIEPDVSDEEMKEIINYIEFLKSKH
ncbi:helix-turn-helix domain-containing protein [Eremococcus coleocola]|uniref:helix-turn-helix domain-containing protein n=1 Tax=Eremococcus coleocola TaxID=88132 RepID=UPI0004238978|nr:helix-turn-helix transcriptional regulator [Eremococcus coleocola]